ncbi:RNA degradosome polyphosphate kinase [Actinomadura craniellae]|uniref:Polyphosphate kinase n=1 Tax=Actinomadura craniellae TaxID=2231787 RepID=A0A365HE40_9ACTN|nr:RNA degradosome polyphosphate kinase [Actinomadura craniellae]RAY17186.1 RNA degradosome polyphosphate kinase [Actinomadura craniellae]
MDTLPARSPELPADRFHDREESWLRFNQRVLELAEDPGVPLLERVRFLSIFSSNLDEFFMVRVAGLLRRMATGLVGESASRRQPRQVFARIGEVAHELVLRQARCFHEEICPALAAQGIEILRWEALTGTERSALRKLFTDSIQPVLTPLVVDQAHPFPYISGLSLNLAVVARDPTDGTTRLARVKVPPSLPRFVEAEPGRFALLEDVIAEHLDELFIGMEIIERHAFRVTRNADLDVDEDITEDLLQALERELARRRFGPAVRLEVEESITPQVLEWLVEELDVEPEQVYRLPGPLDLAGLSDVTDLDRPELKYPPFIPDGRALPSDTDVFTTLRERDVLVHHPYDSFARSVQRLVEEAAADPQVMAIKQTLYRTSGDSPIVDALIDAAEAGKQVVVIVEIKARFDERANISWARKLERAGCHVVFGFVDLKTHCKLALIVRREADGTLRRYCHIGTGNYHPKTARLYEDLGLFTADPEIAADVASMFNHLTGFSRPSEYRRLLASPTTLRAGLVDRIAREVEHHRAGRPARIRFKCNAMVDGGVIDALYRASQEGVPIEIWVRGICALRPGLPDLSETIQVRSVLGRFLEHSRIYAFEGGGEPEVWIGSADLMHRNLDRRVETLVQVTDPVGAGYLAALFDRAMDDETTTWRLDSAGHWTRCGHDDVQEHLMRLHGRARVTVEES